MNHQGRLFRGRNVAFLLAGVGSLDSPMKKTTGFFLSCDFGVAQRRRECFCHVSCIQKTNKSFPESFQEATFFVFFVGLAIFFLPIMVEYFFFYGAAVPLPSSLWGRSVWTSASLDSTVVRPHTKPQPGGRSVAGTEKKAPWKRKHIDPHHDFLKGFQPSIFGEN